MTFPVQIEMGNHAIVAQLHALPRVGDLISCSFPSSGIPRLLLEVKSVNFHQPNIEFEGKECPQSFHITITTDGHPRHKAHNDAAMRKAIGAPDGV